LFAPAEKVSPQSVWNKNALRGCALGAGVDGCRSNRASARECAKAHSFLSGNKSCSAGFYEEEDTSWT